MKPTVGQQGTFFSGCGATQRCEVAHVWSDTCVNLRCADGSTPTSVLVANDMETQPHGYYVQLDAEGARAPRVTPADIESAVVHTEIVKHVSQSGQVLRWAVLTTRNGFAVTGRPSAAVCSENDDPAIGERVAIDNARSELWPLLGYALRERLAGV